MGELKDLVKENSVWLKLQVGEFTIVKYVDFKIVPSSIDPQKNVAQFQLQENGKIKYWTNGSGKVMLVFDELTKGKDWVKISRLPWKDKAGKVVEGKSEWVVEKTDSVEEKAWDE